jgi:hypothetical protein
MLSYTRSIKIYRTGTIAKLRNGGAIAKRGTGAIAPPLTAVPKDYRLTEPAPLEKNISSKLRMKTEVVING